MKASRIAGILAVAIYLGLGLASRAQNADGFNPGAVGGSDGVLALAVQPDGGVIIGGDFTNVAGITRSNLARLDANGTLDISFDPEPDGEIRALAVQTNGQILVSGFFTTLGGITQNRIARLNSNGTVDASFNPNVTGDVYGMLVQADGKILVWGEFSQLAGQPINRIGRLNTNGTFDSSFNPGSGASDSVLSVALQADGKMVVGGYEFSSLAGHACNGIGRLNADGSFDTSYTDSYFGSQNQLNLNIVYSVIVQPDGKILVAGANRQASINFINYALRFDDGGSLDAGFQNQTADNPIYTMALQSDGEVLVGGLFSTLNSQPRSRIARITANGSPDGSFTPAADDRVYCLAMQADGKILAAGRFASLAGGPRIQVGRITNTGTVQQSFSVNAKGTAISWQRSGPGPELQEVSFEQSQDGTNFTFLGNCKYLAGGWQLAGISVPGVQTFYLRARGRGVGGYFSASSGLIDQVTQIYWVPPPLVFLDNGSLRYTFVGGTNASYSMFASTELTAPTTNWDPLGLAAYLGDGYYQYIDLDATNFSRRFYRTVKQ